MRFRLGGVLFFALGFLGACAQSTDAAPSVDEPSVWISAEQLQLALDQLRPAPTQPRRTLVSEILVEGRRLTPEAHALLGAGKRDAHDPSTEYHRFLTLSTPDDQGSVNIDVTIGIGVEDKVVKSVKWMTEHIVAD